MYWYFSRLTPRSKRGHNSCIKSCANYFESLNNLLKCKDGKSNTLVVFLNVC